MVPSRTPLERLLTFKPWVEELEERNSPTDVLGLQGQALLAVGDPSPLPSDSDSTQAAHFDQNFVNSSEDKTPQNQGLFFTQDQDSSPSLDWLSSIATPQAPTGPTTMDAPSGQASSQPSRINAEKAGLNEHMLGSLLAFDDPLQVDSDATDPLLADDGSDSSSTSGSSGALAGTAVVGAAGSAGSAAPADSTGGQGSISLVNPSSAANQLGSAGAGSLGGSSASPAQSLSLLPTTTSLASSMNPSAPGQNVTITATVSAGSGGGTPTGTVTFADNGTTLGSANLSGSGSPVYAYYTTSTLPLGSNSLTASYSGNSSFSASSGGMTQRVQLTATTTSLTSSVNPSYPGENVNLTATVSVGPSGGGTPTGTVNFYDGTTSLGSQNLSGTPDQAILTTSFQTLGSHNLTATYVGNSSFSASSGGMTQTLQLATTSTSLTSSVNPSYPGQTVTFTATVTGPSGGGTPTGTVTFFDGGRNQIGTGTLSVSNNQDQATFFTSSLAQGSHSITASYGGDSTFAGSTSYNLDQNVNLLPTTNALTSSQNPSFQGQEVTLVDTISAVSGGGTPTPTGTVTFFDTTTNTNLGSADLGNSGSPGQASLEIPSLTTGNHNITATYGGDSTFAGSSGSISQYVNPSTTGIVMGQVWFDLNANGLIDPDENGVANVTVNLLLNGSGTPIGTTTTNASGNYLFTNVNPNSYAIQVIAPQGDVFTSFQVGTIQASWTLPTRTVKQITSR